MLRPVRGLALILQAPSPHTAPSPQTGCLRTPGPHQPCVYTACPSGHQVEMEEEGGASEKGSVGLWHLLGVVQGGGWVCKVCREQLVFTYHHHISWEPCYHWGGPTGNDTRLSFVSFCKCLFYSSSLFELCQRTCWRSKATMHTVNKKVAPQAPPGSKERCSGFFSKVLEVLPGSQGQEERRLTLLGGQLHRKHGHHCLSGRWGVCPHWCSWLSTLREPWPLEILVTAQGLPSAVWFTESVWPELFLVNSGDIWQQLRGLLWPGTRCRKLHFQDPCEWVELWLTWSLSHLSQFSFLGEFHPDRRLPSFNFKQ